MTDHRAAECCDVTRRSFLSAAGGAALVAGLNRPAVADEPTSHQATGIKIGEVTPNSAIVWCRLTRNLVRNDDGVVFAQPKPKEPPQPVTVPVDAIEGACPGMAGRMRVRYGTGPDLRDAVGRRRRRPCSIRFVINLRRC